MYFRYILDLRKQASGWRPLTIFLLLDRIKKKKEIKTNIMTVKSCSRDGRGMFDLSVFADTVAGVKDIDPGYKGDMEKKKIKDR